MTFDPSKPYNELPLLPPVADVESRAVLKACIGILRERKIGREKIFLNPAFIDLLKRD